MSILRNPSRIILILVCASAMMILYCIQSLDEENYKLSKWEIFGVLCFAIVSRQYLTFMLLFRIKTEGVKRRGVIWAAGLLIGCSILVWGTGIPYIVLHTMTVIAGILLLQVIQDILYRLEDQKIKNEKAISSTVIRELYEKKLNQELLKRQYLSEQNARLEERETISRNIHNSVGHSITAAIMTLDAADMLFEQQPERAREKMNQATTRIRGSLDQIRQAVRVLDHKNEFVSMEDFQNEISIIIDSFMMDTMRQVTFLCESSHTQAMIPREHTEFLSGAVEEILSNGVKHGNAERFHIYIQSDQAHIKVTVQDNGTSDFRAENSEKRIQDGFGIRKMISYTQRFGGYVTYGNNQGFITEIQLPLYGEKKDEDIISG